MKNYNESNFPLVAMSDDIMHCNFHKCPWFVRIELGVTYYVYVKNRVKKNLYIIKVLILLNDQILSFFIKNYFIKCNQYNLEFHKRWQKKVFEHTFELHNFKL